MRYFRVTALLITLCGVLGAQEMAAPVEDLLSKLTKYNEDGKPVNQRYAFEFPDAILNAYLGVAIQQRPRPGIERASMKLLAGNRVGVEAAINLDELTERPKGMAKKLKGVQPAVIEVKFQVANGKLALSCEKFLLAGNPLSSATAADLIRILGAMQPEKFDTTRPVPLPMGLKKLTTENGSLTGDTRQ